MSESVQHKEQRVGIFVDASNMYFSAQNLYGTTVNFSGVLNSAVGKRRLLRAFAYVVESDNNKEKDFFNALTDIGYEVRSKPLQIFSSGAKKGDWDVGIAMDIVRTLPLIDTVILVSGDGDFVDLLDYCRGHGRRTEVMAFKKTASSRLIDEADEFIDLSSNKRKFLQGRRRK